jgi:hypothetical protein
MTSTYTTGVSTGVSYWDDDERNINVVHPKQGSYHEEDFGKILKDIAKNATNPFDSDEEVDDDDDIYDSCDEYDSDEEHECDCNVCQSGVLYDANYDPVICRRYAYDEEYEGSNYSSQRSSYNENELHSYSSSDSYETYSSDSPKKRFFYT